MTQGKHEDNADGFMTLDKNWFNVAMDLTLAQYWFHARNLTLWGSGAAKLILIIPMRQLTSKYLVKLALAVGLLETKLLDLFPT